MCAVGPSEMGMLRVLGHRGTRETLIAVLSRLHFGSDGFAIVADAEGKRGRHSCSLWGRGEAHATGVVAALVAKRLNTSSPLDHSVFRVEQLFDPREIFAYAGRHGVSFDPDRVS